MKKASILLITASLFAGDWSAPVEVRHDETLCLTYRARLDGPYLVVEAKIESPWHTFSMDNTKRAEEKLAGKKAISMDRPTEIVLSGGLAADGGWLQTPPKDFSKPQLRWFSWGFEDHATFAVKVKRLGAGPAKLAIKGQACTDSICRNIDTSLTVTASKPGASAELDLGGLTPVR